jgi:hypothetical protein
MKVSVAAYSPSKRDLFSDFATVVRLLIWFFLSGAAEGRAEAGPARRQAEAEGAQGRLQQKAVLSISSEIFVEIFNSEFIADL